MFEFITITTAAVILSALATEVVMDYYKSNKSVRDFIDTIL